jgi:ribosomal protein S8
MSRIYQPIVIEETNNLIEGLKESGFFQDYQIEDLTFTNQHLLDIMTEKFINGQLDSDDELFGEDEFAKLLQELVAGSVLYELKEKGYINSYEDDETEEMFFLTEDGKKFLKNIKPNDDSDNDGKILKDMF